MKCPKCEGRGFTELEHGLIQVKCPDCDKGEIPDDNRSDSGAEETLVEVAAEANAFANALMPRLEGEKVPYLPEGDIPTAMFKGSKEIIKDDSSSGTGPDNKPTRSGDPGKSKQPKKRKAKKKVTKRAR